MRRVNWFPDCQREPFRNCWRDGVSVQSLQERFGLSEAQVEHRRKFLGLQPRRPHGAPSQSWSEARIEKLKQLDSDGDSASQIAARLNLIEPLHLPLTRNAVIGKLSRLQGGKTPTGRPKPAWNRGIRKPRAQKPAKPPRKAGAAVIASWADAEVRAEAGPLPGDVLPFLDVKEGQCRWVLNDPKAEAAVVCGKPTVATTHDGQELPRQASVYCARHLYLSIGPNEPQGRDPRVQEEIDQHG